MSAPKFTVAICGGGVAGLATAVSIAHFSPTKDIKVDVYEAKDALAEIGAGVSIWPRPWAVLKAFGLQDDFKKICQNPNISSEPCKALAKIMIPLLIAI